MLGTPTSCGSSSTGQPGCFPAPTTCPNATRPGGQSAATRSSKRPGQRQDEASRAGRATLDVRVEVPCPALAAANLHVVVCCVPCRVTCAACWAALCFGESNPVRYPPRCPGGA